MKRKQATRSRQFRGKTVILNLLNAYQQSGLSIQAFCVEQKIATGNFHRWKKQYSEYIKSDEPVVAGFSNLQIEQAPGKRLFAEVKGIKLYQPVSAAYLKEFVS